MQIKGTSALITGGGSGLGKAVARALSGRGAKVSVLDIDFDSAARVAAEVDGFAVAADVASARSVEEALALVAEHAGTPTIIVNCAGIGHPGRVVGKNGPLSLDAFERVISINLIGTFNVMRLAAHAISMTHPQDSMSRGVIVNTASVAAFDGQIGQAAYAASKGGIVAMGLPIAREFAQLGIRVNTIAPGVFQTPLLETLPKEAQRSLAAAIPFPKRLGQPDEFAHAVVFCIENDYINGETIRLDAAHRLPPR